MRTDKCIVCESEEDVPDHVESVMWVSDGYGQRLTICDKCIKNENIEKIENSIELQLIRLL